MNEDSDKWRKVSELGSVEDQQNAFSTAMKSRQAFGPDYIPVEVQVCLAEKAVNFLTKLFNAILERKSLFVDLPSRTVAKVSCKKNPK